MIANQKRPIIISGPCSVETLEQTLETCCAIAKSGQVDVLRGGIWKPRTMPGCFEGVGEVGLEWLYEAKKITGLPITIEVANTAHIELALKHEVDILWIGARTTVNPFSVQEIANALKGVKTKVMIKNPVNPDVALWTGAVERIANAGISDLALIHRGFSSFAISGMRNAPLWDLALEMRQRFPGLPIICDPSHIAGEKKYIQQISQQAADLSYDGLMIESHINPAYALSDKAQQLTPRELIKMLGKIVWRDKTTDKPEYLQAIDGFRNQIDQYDIEIIELIASRMKIAEKIGEIKRDNNLTIYQSERWDAVVDRILADSQRLGLSTDFLTQFLDCMHFESIGHQNKIMNK